MPGLVRALRKIYGRLYAESHINNKAAILVRVRKKLIFKNKILRIENEGLRDAIFKKKTKKETRQGFKFS
jgi:regulator of replication initiation timing